MKKLLLLFLALAFVFIASPVNANSNQATVVNLETGHRKVVTVGDQHAFDGGYALEIDYGVQPIPDDDLGFSVATSYKTTLSASMTSSQSTINVSSVTSKDDTTLTMGLLGSKVYLTIEPGGNKEEIVLCTGISGSAWTGCTRGLAFTGTSTAAVSANKETHSAGSTIIMSNVHYVYDELVDKDTADSIGGVKTFTEKPIYDSSISVLATDDGKTIITKEYADGLAITAGATSTESVLGFSQLATQLETASSTHDSQNPAVLYSKYASSTPSLRQLGTIPVTENDGYLNQGWLDLTEDFAFTGTTTLATTTIADAITASTTITNGFVTSVPTRDSDIVNKTYSDSNDSGVISDYDHVQKTVAMTTNSNTYVLRNEIGVGTFTMGANDMAIIRIDMDTTSSGNNENMTIVLGNGVASTTLYTKDDGTYTKRFFEFKIMNRNSVSAQSILYDVWRSTPANETYAWTTSAVDLSNGFNILATVDNDAQDTLTGTSEYFDVTLFKP